MLPTTHLSDEDTILHLPGTALSAARVLHGHSFHFSHEKKTILQTKLPCKPDSTHKASAHAAEPLKRFKPEITI